MVGLKGYLVLMISLILVSTRVENLSTLTIDQTKQGITAGQAIVDSISQADFANTLTKTTTSIGPYLAAISPFVGFVLSLVPSESPELQYMKQMMRNIDNRFDQVHFINLDDIKRKIEWHPYIFSFASMEDRIDTMSEHVRNLYRAPKLAIQNKKDLFIRAYHTGYQDSGFKLYNAATKNKWVFQKNLCAAVMKFEENDRRQTQKFMLEILKLLMRAANIELTFHGINSSNSTKEYVTDTWKKRFKDVVSTFKSVDIAVQNNYHDQSGSHVAMYAADNPDSDLSNGYFARGLFNRLNNKYYWRDWIVVAYDELRGYDNHCVSVCGGHIKFCTNGRNILVASVDKNKPVMDLGRAESTMEGVSVSTYHRGWWMNHGHDQKRTAKEIYDSFDDIYGACSVGVIKKHSNLWFPHNSRKFKLVKRDYFNLFMWG